MKRSAPMLRTGFKRRQPKVIGVDLASRSSVTVLARVEPVPGRIARMVAIWQQIVAGVQTATRRERAAAQWGAQSRRIKPAIQENRKPNG